MKENLLYFIKNGLIGVGVVGVFILLVFSLIVIFEFLVLYLGTFPGGMVVGGIIIFLICGTCSIINKIHDDNFNKKNRINSDE